MKPEDIGPILAMAEHRERREWRRKQSEAFRDDGNSRMPSDRYRRACQFGHQVLSMLQKFIPEACVDDALEELMTTAYGHDVEIRSVPPERDAERAAAIKAAEAMIHPPTIIR